MVRKTELLAFLFLAILASVTVQAQNLIAVSHEGQSSFFTELQPALDAAVDGDTVYLPGGFFQEEITISKRLALIGVGYHPDSTIATLPTILNKITLAYGAGNGLLTGLKISDGIIVDGAVNDIEISRCLIGDGGVTIEISENSVSNNFILKQNLIIGDFNILGTISGYRIFNNSMGGIDKGAGLIVSNNVISLVHSVEGFSNCQFLNNIIYSGGTNSENCTFLNNIVYYAGVTDYLVSGYSNLNGYLGSNYASNNNLHNGLASPIFENDYQNYGYYQFTNPIYNSSGTDGTPVGIYGGLYPWKAGGVPYNPHVQTKTISSTTNAQGGLNVQIRVAAQDH